MRRTIPTLILLVAACSDLITLPVDPVIEETPAAVVADGPGPTGRPTGPPDGVPPLRQIL